MAAIRDRVPGASTPWIVGVALAVRVAVAIASRGNPPLYDAHEYDADARSIAAGGGYVDTPLAAPGTPTAIHPPGYPYLLGLVYRVTGDSQNAGRLLGAVLGTVAVILVLAIGRRVFGEPAGTVAGAIAAVHPPLVALAGALLSESLFVPLVLATVLATMAHRTSPRPLASAALIGLLCGLAALTRANGVVLVVPALAVVIARPGRAAPGRAVAGAAVVVAALAISISPWVVRNASSFDEPTFLTTGAGYNLAVTYNEESERSGRARPQFPPALPELRSLFERPGIDEAELDRRLRHDATDFAVDHPGLVARALFWNSVRMFRLAGEDADVGLDELGIGEPWRPVLLASGVVLAVLAIAGAILLATRRFRPAGPWTLWATPVLLWLSVVPALGNERFRIPIDPFLILLAAVALAWGARRIERRGRPA